MDSWLLVQNLEAEDEMGDQIMDPQSQYDQFRIPWGRIRGCFHGWIILSNNIMWSIWNPVTCDVRHLPPLILEGVNIQSIDECCLSSPPGGDTTSLLLLTIHRKPTIVYCKVGCSKLEWTEMSYAIQLRDMELGPLNYLYCLTCCNGEIYSLISWNGFIMHVDINHVVKDHGQEEVVISVLPMVEVPCPNFFNCYNYISHFLKGDCANQLFYIILGFDEVSLRGVYLYKLNMTRMIWEELHDLKDAIFILDLAHENMVYYLSGMASDLGGYVHILGKNGKAMHSLHIKDKIVSLTSMPSCLMSSNRLSLWECTRLPCDHEELKCISVSKPVEGNGDNIMLEIHTMKNKDNNNESCLLNIPLNVLEMIMELFVGVDYLNFRATCKTCLLGAPIIGWNKVTALSKLQTPWLVVVNHRQGLITFTDPVFGDNYYIKIPRELNAGDMRILCSGYGWMLMMIVQPLLMEETRNRRIVFFNPFTHDIRELPAVHLDMFCFSAPPTSPECLVVAFSKCLSHVYIHFVVGEPTWRRLVFDADPGSQSLRFLTFHGPDLYALRRDAELVIIREIEGVQDHSCERVTAKAGTSRRKQYYFLMKSDEKFLMVKMSEFGEHLQVYKLNDSTKEWEKIYGLGRHTIYICDTTCVYIEAKTQEMENKIYFQRLHSENQKIVFYSLETCTYHTSDGENLEQNLFGTQHNTYTHTWIQPSWS